MKVTKVIEKIYFQKISEYYLKQEKSPLNSFKGNVFPIENLISDPTFDPAVFYTLKQTRFGSKIPKIKISKNQQENAQSIRIHHFQQNVQ